MNYYPNGPAPEPHFDFFQAFLVNHHSFPIFHPLWWGVYFALAAAAFATMLFFAEGVMTTFLALGLGALALWFCGDIMNLHSREWHENSTGFVIASVILFVGIFAEVMLKWIFGLVMLWAAVAVIILLAAGYYLLTMFAPGLVTVYPTGVAFSTNMAYPGEFFDPYFNQVILPWLIIILVGIVLVFAVKKFKKG